MKNAAENECVLSYASSTFLFTDTDWEQHWYHIKNSRCRWHDVFRAYLCSPNDGAKKGEV